MIRICYFKYSDGVCGIFEESHSLARTARELHTFTPMFPADVEINEDGKLAFSRDFAAGETVTIPTEFMDTLLTQITGVKDV